MGDGYAYTFEYNNVNHRMKGKDELPLAFSRRMKIIESGEETHRKENNSPTTRNRLSRSTYLSHFFHRRNRILEAPSQRPFNELGVVRAPAYLMIGRAFEFPPIYLGKFG